MTNSFEGHPRKCLSIGFRDTNIDQVENTMCISQQYYITNNQFTSVVLVKNRNMTCIGLQQHRQVQGLLMWIATGTSTSFACAGSISLQTALKHIYVLSVNQNCLRVPKETNLPTMSYIPLQYTSTNIRLYSDVSYQNLKHKNSQTVFIIILSD